MKFEIDWSQASTKRGVVWVAAAVIGLLMIMAGKYDDANQVILLAGAVAGGLGVAVKD